MFSKKKYNIVTSIALLSIISLNPTISYSKEIQNQNFFSKLFSKISLQQNQSSKEKIYKSDINSLNIDTLISIFRLIAV